MWLEPSTETDSLLAPTSKVNTLGPVCTVQHAVGTGVDWSKWWNSATSPHVHVVGLLQLLGGGDVGGSHCCIRTRLAHRGRIHRCQLGREIFPWSHSHVFQLGCPNFTSKKVSLQSETKRNTNGFIWFCFLFAKLWGENFASFRFILLHFASFCFKTFASFR